MYFNLCHFINVDRSRNRFAANRPSNGPSRHVPPPPVLIAPKDAPTPQRYRFVSNSQMPHFSPLLSFKSYVQTQRDDLSPEVYQKLYDDFQLQYIMDLSLQFFHTNKQEEWFRDRYDPSRIIQRDEAATAWSIKESSVLRNALVENALEVLDAISLEPISAKPIEKLPIPVVANASTTTEPTASNDEVVVLSADDDNLSRDGKLIQLLFTLNH